METARKLDSESKPKRRWKKALWMTSGIIVLLIVSAVIFVNAYTSRSVPQSSGDVQINGLSAPVTVTRDEEGVPHIQAENEQDLFMAQGFVQAQDRLFQMELARRQASGRLSEVVGEATVEQDRYFRTLGLRRAAEKSLAGSSAESIERMEAFSEGINTFMEEEPLPPEFAMMGIEPEPWTPLDSLTIGKYMAFDLGGHWERQAFNYHLLQQFPEEEAYELFPTYPEDAPTVLADGGDIDIEKRFSGAVLPHEFNGSNNWAVSGDRTASGEPLLANDPHLGMATPSIWYQMHLEAPDYHVSGVIFAGTPGIILGHNDDIAWGVTNVGPDVQQLYLEKRNPGNPQQFLYEDEWEDADVFEETIEVKDGETVEMEVLETRHGPVISEFAGATGEETVMSLRWTALDASTELEAVIEMNRANDWESFEKGLEKFLVPAQNFVFASQDGTIAYKANGQIPVYEEADDALLPLRGWEEEDEWKGFIPFDELPTTVNPEEGFVATANNKITSEDYPYHISHNWAQPFRYQRIAEMLDGKNELVPEDFQRMQMDVKNLQAEEFLPLLLSHVQPDTGTEEDVMTMMKSWNMEDDRELSQPLIFHKWMGNIQDELYDEEIPAGVQEFFQGSGQTTDELLRKGEDSLWMEKAGGIDTVITNAYQNTITEVTEEFGDDPESWRWGKAHAVEFTHPLSSIGFLERFLNTGDPLPVSGSRVTVRAAGFNDEGLVNHGASWRFVIDMEDTSEAYHMVGPGQSGHFRSEWYQHQIADWVEGEYHLTKTQDAEGDVLTLSP